MMVATQIAESFRRELRVAARRFSHTPSTFVVGAVALGLGIGSATALFTIIEKTILQPLPYPRADRLVQVWEVSRAGEHLRFADPTVDDLQSRTRTLAAVARFQLGGYSTVILDATPTRAQVAYASNGYFDVLETKPMYGRLFSKDEAQENGPLAVILSSRLQRELYGERVPVGEVLTIDGRRYRVIGVMPPTVGFPAAADLWFPVESRGRTQSRTARHWQVIARVRGSLSIDDARSEMHDLARAIISENSGQTNMGDIGLGSLQEQLVGDLRGPVTLLLLASLTILLVAVFNVVSLMLARSDARRGEYALRIALGAAFTEVVMACLSEAFLLAAGGVFIGLSLATSGLKVLISTGLIDMPRLSDASLSSPGVAFSAVLALASVVVVTAASSLRMRRSGVGQTLAQHQRSLAKTKSVWPGLVVGQIAATVALLGGLAVLGRSFIELTNLDLGFRPANLVLLDAVIPARDSAAARRRANDANEIVSRLEQVPGIKAAAVSNIVPMGGGGRDGAFAIVKRPNEPADVNELAELFKDPDKMHSAGLRVVTPDYFRTLGIPLLKGRLPTANDAPNGTHVAVISASLAATAWPNANPIGALIQYGNMDGDLRTLTVVGVVGDVRERGAGFPARPTLYALLSQRPNNGDHMTFVARTDGGAPPRISSAMREALRSVRPDVAPQVRSMESLIMSNLGDRRVTLITIGVFGLIALVLATLGIYSVLSYSVAQRHKEIGIRMALGAERKTVLLLFLKPGIRMTIVGIALGLAALVPLKGVLAHLVFGVGALDPLSLTAAVTAVLAASGAASYIPARRATGVAPAIALRGD